MANVNEPESAATGDLDDAVAAIEPGSLGAPLQYSITHLLHRAQQLAAERHATVFGARGLTQRQYAVLRVLAERSHASQAEIVRESGIDRSTLAEMMGRMSKRGLVERTRSRIDSRANDVRLTDAGRKLFNEAAPKIAAIDEELLSTLGPRKQEALVLALMKIALPDEHKAIKAQRKKFNVKRKKYKPEPQEQ